MALDGEARHLLDIPKDWLRPNGHWDIRGWLCGFCPMLYLTRFVVGENHSR
jgi:hypothetical protein